MEAVWLYFRLQPHSRFAPDSRRTRTGCCGTFTPLIPDDSIGGMTPPSWTQRADRAQIEAAGVTAAVAATLPHSRARYAILALLATGTLINYLDRTVVGIAAPMLARDLGIAEAPCFPANSRVVATWFPQQERAFATSVYTVGEYVGLALLSPLLFWVLSELGWRWLFVITGVIGLTFAVVWWVAYREP